MRKDKEAFLDYLEVERGLSKNTIYAYDSDLTGFIEFFENTEFQSSSNLAVTGWDSIKAELITSALDDMNTREYSSSTRSRKISCLRSFIKFLLDENVIDKNPAINIETPRAGKGIPRILTIEQIDHLLSTTKQCANVEEQRDYCMIEIMYASGLRVSELVGLDLKSLDSELLTVKAIGKGSKERLLPLHRTATETIHNYLSKVRPILQKRNSPQSLFLNRLGKRMTRQGFWQRLKKSAENAGIINPPISPHTIRHTFATHLCMAELH